MPAATPFIHRNLPRLLLQAREAVMLHTRPSLRGQGLSNLRGVAVCSAKKRLEDETQSNEGNVKE